MLECFLFLFMKCLLKSYWKKIRPHFCTSENLIQVLFKVPNFPKLNFKRNRLISESKFFSFKILYVVHILHLMGSDWQITILVSTFQKHFFSKKRSKNHSTIRESQLSSRNGPHKSLCLLYKQNHASFEFLARYVYF